MKPIVLDSTSITFVEESISKTLPTLKAMFYKYIKS